MASLANFGTRFDKPFFQKSSRGDVLDLDLDFDDLDDEGIDNDGGPSLVDISPSLPSGSSPLVGAPVLGSGEEVSSELPEEEEAEEAEIQAGDDVDSSDEKEDEAVSDEEEEEFVDEASTESVEDLKVKPVDARPSEESSKSSPSSNRFPSRRPAERKVLTFVNGRFGMGKVDSKIGS